MSYAERQREIDMRYRRERRKSLLLWGTLGTLSLLLTLFLCASLRIGDGHEDGYSVGTLINVRQEGALWEARPAANLLHTGEMKGDEYAMEAGLYDHAVELADRSARVRITYANRFVCWAWNYSSCNIITKIEEMPVP